MLPFNIAALFNLVPYIVAGVEQIHKDASSADKKTLAQEALGLALGGANQVLTGGNKTLANNVAQASSVIIDSTVSLFNALGMFTHKTAPAAAAPAPVVPSAV